MKLDAAFISFLTIIISILPASADDYAADNDDIVRILSATSGSDSDPTTVMLMIDDGFSQAPLFDHPLAQEMIYYAASHLGRPYRSGGKGPTGFDCSGFTSYIFKKFGYTLNPSSSMQYTQGMPVDIRLVRPGDLLFFSGRHISSTRVGHVGMVVDVDIATQKVKFIHSASNGGIRYDIYPDDPYYRLRFIGARRILSDPE